MLQSSSPAAVSFRGVERHFGSVKAVDGVDLDIAPGEFFAMLGPSGSGKTTCLRLIAGFDQPSAGHIEIFGEAVEGVPAYRRPVNTVFQDYALFPHLTVSGNVGYGLSVRRVPRKEIASRVAQALELVQLGLFAERFPAQLSGGQRQRVALARALICQPRLILLDEPLAALDLELRRQMQEFLKSIQREIKTTFLFVTHDQEEAIGMADRICVMQAGHIRQLGTPHELYYKPNCEFVARFFGENNLVAGTLGPVQDDLRSIDTVLGRLVCSIAGQQHLKAAANGARAFAAFRPEALRLAGTHDASNRFSGRIADLAFAGSSTIATVVAGEGATAPRLRLRFPSQVDGSALKSGETVALSFAPHEGHLVLA